MPTYEYECQKCGHRFELFQMMSEEPKKRCPECRGKVKRLIGSGAGIIFKGSGFYQTDYRSDSYKKAAKAEKTKSNGSDSKSKSGTSDTATGATEGKSSKKKESS